MTVAGERASSPHEGRFCYLVMCHTDAALVRRLVERIRALHPGALVVVRHDRGPGFVDETDARSWGAELLHSDIRIVWGGWSMVAATLEAFRRVREDHDPDWLVVVSGHDYPLRPLQEWAGTVAAGGADAVVAPDDDVQVNRYTHAWRPLPRWRAPVAVRRALTLLWWRVGFPLQSAVLFDELPRGNGWIVGTRRIRSFPHADAYTQASQWMTLSRRAVQRVLEQDDQDPGRRREFALTRIPDESYLPSLLCADEQLTVVRRRTSWVRFVDREPHPRPLTVDDVDEAVASGAPFGRKVVPGTSDPALDRLDEVHRPPTPGP